MPETLQQSWIYLTSKYTDDKIHILDLWNYLYKNYTSKKRHYHNFNHIHHMLDLASNCKDELKDYDILCYAIWYHDVIYNPLKKNNEVKSADIAEKSLKSLKIDTKSIEKCKKLIVSTQKHEILISENQDNAYLLDIDLAILASDWEIYKTYTQHIRKEYAMYPDFMYKKGRKKVLQHFLERPKIYYSEKYHNLWESIARENIQKELNFL